jgi:hypothetical protein
MTDRDPAPSSDDPPAASEDIAGDLVPRERRPVVERIGMAAIAAVLAMLFGGVAVAAWVGGEPFLAVMGGIGCLMTAWVGGLTLFRG